jgi:hypothetical protein
MVSAEIRLIPDGNYHFPATDAQEWHMLFSTEKFTNRAKLPPQVEAADIEGILPAGPPVDIARFLLPDYFTISDMVTLMLREKGVVDVNQNDKDSIERLIIDSGLCFQTPAYFNDFIVASDPKNMEPLRLDGGANIFPFVYQDMLFIALVQKFGGFWKCETFLPFASTKKLSKVHKIFLVKSTT